jgi:ABC-2 type transport system permease protein
MITPAQLFFRRVRAEWRFQYGVWKTAIDWTVALYIVIPAALIGLNYYALLWKNQYGWMEGLSFNWLLIAVYLFAWSGWIRTFMEEGDQLFLLRCKGWVKRIVALGLGYSVVLNIFSSFLVFFVFAPLLFVHYKLSTVQVMLFLVFVILFKTGIGLAKQLGELRFQGWKKAFIFKIAMVSMGFIFLKSIPFLLGQPGLLLTTCALLSIFFGFLTKMRLGVKESFFYDVAREQSERLRYAFLLLSLSGLRIKKPGAQKRRPWLFRSSNQLFRKRNAVNSLVELCIKSVLRNNKSLLSFAQLLAAGILLLLSFPFWWKVIIWPALAYLLASLAGSYWKEAISSGFVQLFQWNPADKSTAAAKSIFLLTLPGILALGFAAGWQTYSWLGACAALPAGVLLGYFTTQILSPWLINSTERVDRHAL